MAPEPQELLIRTCGVRLAPAGPPPRRHVPLPRQRSLYLRFAQRKLLTQVFGRQPVREHLASARVPPPPHHPDPSKK